uniref:Uncharacterized protein n=1 Tax=Heterorhabditis bacteriophora TaxID=37862 RepID=A0A1I7W964_HETBA
MRNFLILLNFLLSIALAKVVKTENVNYYFQILNVGLLCAYNNTDIATLLGWRNVAGAVVSQINGLIEVVNLSFKIFSSCTSNILKICPLTWKMTECIESLSAGAIIQYVDDNANVVLGPPCSSGRYFSKRNFKNRHVESHITLILYFSGYGERNCVHQPKSTSKYLIIMFIYTSLNINL